MTSRKRGRFMPMVGWSGSFFTGGMRRADRGKFIDSWWIGVFNGGGMDGRRWRRFFRSCSMFGDVRGCSEVLVSFQSENAVARTLYESLGFRERSRGGGKVTAALDFAG